MVIAPAVRQMAGARTFASRAACGKPRRHRPGGRNGPRILDVQWKGRTGPLPMPIPRSRSHAGPALLSAGFRPFFLGAAIWAALAVPLWLAVFAGKVEVPSALAPTTC